MIPPSSLSSDLLLSMSMDPTCIARFALFITVLLSGAVLVGKIIKATTRIPTIAGQIVGGIILGPTCFNIAQWAIFVIEQPMVDYKTGAVCAASSSGIFITFIAIISALFTVPYLLWIAGHETELHEIAHVGVVAIMAGVFGALLPIVMIGYVLWYVFLWSMSQAFAMGIIFAATSVSIPVAMLFASQKMHLRSSKATLGSAVIDDIVAVIFLSLFFMMYQNGFFGSEVASFVPHGRDSSLWYGLGLMIGSCIVLFCLGLVAIPPALRLIKKSHYGYMMPLIATIIMLAFFSFSELVGGLAGITGAYFAGLFHRMGDDEHVAQKTIASFVNELLLPLFLASIGLQINLAFLSLADWDIVCIIVLLSVISKMAGSWMATALEAMWVDKDKRWSLLETYLFGASMVARGEVGLVVSTILYGAHVIDYRVYTIAVVAIVATTIITPILLALGFRWHDQREETDDQNALCRKTLNPQITIEKELLFELLKEYLTYTAHHTITIHVSDGVEIMSIDETSAKIMFSPDEGVIFEGKRGAIEDVIKGFKQRVLKDFELVN